MASFSIKRQRKRKRIDTDGDPEFQVAPMVDVLLVLMLFFMAITSTEVLKKNKNLTLADADHGKKSQSNPNEILVNVEWAGPNNPAHLDLDGVPFPQGASSMQGALAARAKDNPAAYALIRPDRNVQNISIAGLVPPCPPPSINGSSMS